MKMIQNLQSLRPLLAVSSAMFLVAGCHTGYETSAYYQPASQTGQSSQPGQSVGGTSSGTMTQTGGESGGGTTTTDAQHQAATTQTGGETSSPATAGTQHQATTTQTNQQNQKQLQAGNQIEIPLYEEQIQVGTRQVDAGAVRLRKQVTTETVTKPVEVRRETLTVNREPMAAAAPNAQAGQQSAPGAAQQNNLSTPFQEGEVVIQLKREEPVVERQMVPAGRIVAQKGTEANQIQVREQVRRENIAVDKLGNPQNVTISQNVTTGAAPSGETAQGRGPSLQGQQQGGGTSEAITDLSTVGTTPNASLAGRSANLSGVKVQRVAGPQLLAIGQEGGPQVFVHSSSPIQGIKEGDTVNVTGTFNKVPSESSSAGWNEQDFQALQGQQVFIDATRVEPSNR